MFHSARATTTCVAVGAHVSGCMSMRRSTTPGRLNVAEFGVAILDGFDAVESPKNRAAVSSSPTRTRTGVFRPVLPYSGDSGFRGE